MLKFACFGTRDWIPGPTNDRQVCHHWTVALALHILFIFVTGSTKFLGFWTYSRTQEVLFFICSSSLITGPTKECILTKLFFSDPCFSMMWAVWITKCGISGKHIALHEPHLWNSQHLCKNTSASVSVSRLLFEIDFSLTFVVCRPTSIYRVVFCPIKIHHHLPVLRQMERSVAQHRSEPCSLQLSCFTMWVHFVRKET